MLTDTVLTLKWKLILFFFLYKDDGPALVSRLLDKLMKSDKYGERRGAAFGLAGVVKGFGISCLKKYGIVTLLQEGLVDRLVSNPGLISWLVFMYML